MVKLNKFTVLLVIIMMSSRMYRIAWSSQNESGHGEYCVGLEAAASWIKILRKDHADMQHWVEYESNNSPCRLPDYLVLAADSSSLHEVQALRLLSARQRDTSSSPQT